jgi:hypothetical protein
MSEATRRRPSLDGFRIGDKVRCQRETPSRGSWPKYDGRMGTVASLNMPDREIGVSFAPNPHEREGSDAWFRPTELAADAPHGRRSPAGASKGTQGPQRPQRRSGG